MVDWLRAYNWLVDDWLVDDWRIVNIWVFILIVY